MKYVKLLTDYNRYNDAGLAQKAANIVAALTDNPNFPTVVPSLADFSALHATYELLLTKALTGDRVLISEKNTARADLIAAMRQLALNVEGQANADKGKLISSGFDLASLSEHVPALKTPADFKITDGMNPGEFKLSCKRDPAATSYLFEYCIGNPQEDGKWVSAVSTTKEYVFRNLPIGARVYVRVTASGRKGQTATSEILSRIVQ